MEKNRKTGNRFAALLLGALLIMSARIPAAFATEDAPDQADTQQPVIEQQQEDNSQQAQITQKEDPAPPEGGGDTPDAPKESVLTGKIKAYKYNAQESTASAISGKSIEIMLGNGQKLNAESSSDGTFTVTVPEEGIAENGKYNWSFKGDSSYLASNGTLSEGKTDVIIRERPVPASSDYSFVDSDNIKNGFLEGAGTYEIKAGQGKKLASSLDGEAKDRISVDVDAGGVVSDFYVYSGSDCSSVLSGEKHKIDDGAPEVTEVTTEAANEKTRVKSHGIYAKKKAELLVKADIKEEGGGLEKVYLISKKDGKKPKFEPVEMVLKNGIYEVSIALPEEETLLDADTVYLVAEDVFGHRSKETLLAKDKDGSSVTLEMIAPTITKEIQGKSQNGWYSEPPVIKAAAEDPLSGIASLTVKEGSKTLGSKTFDEKKVKEAAGLTVTAKAENGKDGAYTYTIEAEDNSGNVSTEEFVLHIDRKAPKLEVTGAADGDAFIEAPTVAIKVDEAHYSEEGNRITAVIKRDEEEPETITFDKTNSASIDPSHFSKDGKYTLTVSAEDAAGNKADDVTITFVKDSVLPEITYSISDAVSLHGWYNKLPKITAAAKDGGSGLFSVIIKQGSKSLNSETYDEAAQNASLDASAEAEENTDGIYQFTVEAKDKAGNVSTKTFSINIDLVAPKLTVTGVANGDYYNKAPSVSISEDEAQFDAEGNRITAVISRKDGETVTKTFDKVKKADLDPSLFSKDGIYSLTISAEDAAGNKAETLGYVFVKDSAKPDVKVDISGKANKNGWYNSLPLITATAEDPLAGLSYITIREGDKELKNEQYEVGTTSKTAEATAEANGSADGTYEFTVEASDRSGNTTTETFSIKMDLDAPVLSSEGITDGEYYIDEPNVKISESEAYPDAEGNTITAVIKREGSLAVTKTFDRVNTADLDPSLFSKDGRYTLTISAEDAAGNKAQDLEYRFIKDSTAPELSIGASGKANSYGWRNEEPNITANSSDAVSGLVSLVIRQDGKKAAEEKYNNSVTEETVKAKADVKDPSKDGSYVFTAIAVDRAGNRATKEITLKIDTVKPELSAEGVETGAHYRSVPTIKIIEKERYAGVDGAFIRYQIKKDGKTNITDTVLKRVREGSIPSRLFSKDGVYAVNISAQDAAGNEAKPLQYKFIKDSTSPKVALSGVKDGKYYNKKQTVKLTVTEKNYKTDNVTVTVTRKLGGKTSKVSFPWANKGETSSSSRTFSETGTYTVTAKAVDKAGNASAVRKLSFTVDTKAPEITITGVSDGGIYTYGEGVNPKISVTDDYPDTKSISYTKGGEPVASPDFSELKENDGFYTLTVSATDKAGNTTRKQLSFVINRFGSYFEYPDATKNIMGTAMQDLDNDVSIIEHNVSKLKSTKEVLYKDGQKVEAVSETRENAGASENVYTHIFRKENFSDEGKYELNVVSKDEAGNEMDSKEENGPVVFYIDRTEPSITVTGIDPKGNNGSSVDLTVKASDLLTGVDEIKAEVNNKSAALTETDEEGVWTLTLKEGMRQPIKITAKDKANNEAVFEDVASVSESAFKLWFDRFGKFVFGGAGAAAALGGGGWFLLGKKKRDDDEEEEQPQEDVTSEQ